MSFLGFYFDKPHAVKATGKSGVIYLKESEFNNLKEKFDKDYKYIVETEEFKNGWGYGYKYSLEDTYMILLNKYKDEIDNDNSLIYFNDENSFIEVQEEYKIDSTNKQYKDLEEI